MIPQNPQINITLLPDGRVNLQSNIDNTIAVYGMLVAAMDAVQKRNEDGAKSSGVIPVAAAALKQLEGVG